MKKRKIQTYLRDLSGLQRAVVQDKEFLFCTGYVDKAEFVKMCEAEGWSVFDFEVKHTWLDLSFDHEAFAYALVASEVEEEEDEEQMLFRVRITRFDLPDFR